MSLKSLSGLKIGDYTLPTSDGTNGQVLQTDGSGNVTFQSVSISDKFTSGLSFDTSTGVLTATVTNGSNVTEDLDGRYVLLGGDTMSGDLTITHAGSPSLHLIDTTNDVDFRLRAANSYVTFEADRDNDAGSSRMQFKIDGSLQYEILPSSTQTFADSTSFIRKDVTGSGGFGFNIITRKATGNTYATGDDLGRINFRGRDDVQTGDTSMASIIAEADNTFTSTDKRSRLKFQVYTGTALNNALELHSDRDVEISGGTLMLGDDVTIFRDGANILRTDDALHANGHIHVGGVSGGGSIYNRADTSNNITFSSSGVAISKDTDITGDLTVSGDITINGDTINTSNSDDYLEFDDDTTTFNPDTNVTTLASVSGIALATNLNDGGGGNFTVSTGSTGTELLLINTSGNATFSGTISSPRLTIGEIASNAQIEANTGSLFLKAGNIQIQGNLIPDADSSRNLGATNRYWENAYIDQITTTGNATFGGDLILNGTAPTLRIQDSRNLNNGDWDNVSLGNIEFYTSDTTSPGARVLAEVEAFSNAAAASGPNAELRFKTSQNTDSSPQTRLTISHDVCR